MKTGKENVGASKVKPLVRILREHYPEAACTLRFSNPLELLVATVLSAQCTDERVNQVTPSLFAKYPTARDYANAPLEELENDIRSTGFYRNKAKNIRKSCEIIQERFAGRVPCRLEALTELPGIGRKTANVVLGNACGVPAITVDTHVARVSRRLGLTHQKDPVKIEKDLMALLPEDRWTLLSHQLIQHGRRICAARKPRCPRCFLLRLCDYGKGLGNEA